MAEYFPYPMKNSHFNALKNKKKHFSYEIYFKFPIFKQAFVLISVLYL